MRITCLLLLCFLYSCHTQEDVDKVTAETNRQLAELDSAIKNQNKGIVYSDKGFESYSNKDYETAISYFTIAIKEFSTQNEIVEKYIMCYNMRGLCYNQINDKEKACADFDMFQSIYNNNQQMHSPFLEEIFNSISKLKSSCQ